MENFDNNIKNKVQDFEQLPDNVNWNADENWQKFTSAKAENKLKIKKYLIPVSVAASVLFLISYFLWMFFLTLEKELIAKSDNTLLNIKLNKDISVTLNKNSSIIVTGNNIRVNGEAYIEINSDKEYYINTPILNATIKTGNFHINSGKNSQTISVLKGNALMKQNNEADMLLKENYYCEINSDYKVYMVSAIENMNFLAWKTGEMIFEDVPLATVTSELEKYYGTSIGFANNEAKNCFVTITVNKNSLDEVFKQLQTQTGIETHKQNNKYLIIGKGC